MAALMFSLFGRSAAGRSSPGNARRMHGIVKRLVRRRIVDIKTARKVDDAPAADARQVVDRWLGHAWEQHFRSRAD
eukprot:3641130-Lingulodinium_polyedra.AAC.1